MKKTVFGLTLAAALMLGLSGCWGNSNSSSQMPMPTPSYTPAPTTVPETAAPQVSPTPGARMAW